MAAVVAGALFYFRNPIMSKIGGLKTLKMAGAEAEFEASAQQLAIEAKEASAEPGSVKGPSPTGWEAPTDAEEAPGGSGKTGDQEVGEGHEILELQKIRRREIASVRESFRIAATWVDNNPKVAIGMANHITTEQARAALQRIEGGFMGPSMTPLDRAVGLLLDQGLSAEWSPLAYGLTRLAEQAKDDSIPVGSSAAADFLTAAERLATELAVIGHDTPMAAKIRADIPDSI